MAQQQTSDGKFYTGTVKWFDTAKGYGFITVKKDGKSDSDNVNDNSNDNVDSRGGRFDNQRRHHRDSRDPRNRSSSEIFFHISQYTSSKYTKPGEERPVPRDKQSVQFKIMVETDSQGRSKSSAIEVSELEE